MRRALREHWLAGVLIIAAGASVGLGSLWPDAHAQAVPPHTEAVYQNSPWALIPPDGVDHYQLTPVPKVVEGVTQDTVSGWVLSVDAHNHTLESNNLRLGCVIVELPIGTTLSDPAALTYAPAEVTDFKNAILFRAPQATLSWPPFFPPASYRLAADRQLYLLTQARNTGSVPIGPVTCVSQVYYLAGAE